MNCNRFGEGLAGLGVHGLAFLITFVSSSAVFAQPPFEVPLRVILGVSTNTMYFGILPGADPCLNPADCFNGHCESELPPIPPQGVFDIRFNVCGIGGTSVDFQPFVSAAQRDTFRIRIQPGAGVDPVILRWPADLSTYFTALTLRYFDGSGNVNIDMLRDTSANLTEASAPTIYSGGLVVNASEDSVGTIPREFVLYQNYPNPFNPETKIGFSLPARLAPASAERAGQAGIQEVGFVLLKVFDVLGREVATLVNEVKQPGTYTVQFDARGLAGGVYMCQLSSGGHSQGRRMLLVK